MGAEIRVAGFEAADRLEETGRSSLWQATGPSGSVLLRLYPQSSWPGPEGLRLRRGLALLEKVEHPAVPLPVAQGEADGALYLAFPDRGSWPLREHVHGTPLEPSEAAEAALQIAEALQSAHGAGLVHGALSPTTVRIEPDTGRIRLLGLEAGAPTAEAPSPEDVAADLRALGRLVAFMLSGLEEPPEGPALRRCCPGLPPVLEWCASRLRRAGTEGGYSQARQVAADLEVWLATAAPSRPEPPRPTHDLSGLWDEVDAEPPARREDPRRRWPWLAGLAVVALWMAWLLFGSALSGPGGPEPLPPDEVVFSEGTAPLDPGRGMLSVEVRGLDPPTTTVQLKVRDGAKVVAEADLEGGRGRLEIPRGRLLTVEVSADLHGQRSRSVLLDERQGMVTLRTVLVRGTEVTIATVPGALVTLDRQPVGQADGRGVLQLAPGLLEVGRVCLVAASKVGYEGREEPFTVKRGHTVVHLDLSPSKGPRRPGPSPEIQPGVAVPGVPWPGPLPAPPPGAADPGRAPGPPPAPVRAKASPLPPVATPAPAHLPSPASSAPPPAENPGAGASPAAAEAQAPGPPPPEAPAPPPTAPPLPPAPAPTSDSGLPLLVPDN